MNSLKAFSILLAITALLIVTSAGAASSSSAPAASPTFAADSVWVHAGKTSAVIYWRLNDISREARGLVEYGDSNKYGLSTEPGKDARYAQSHRLKALEPGKTYHYRIVILDGDKKVPTEDRTFTTNKYADAVEIAVDADGKAAGGSKGAKFGSDVVLDKPNTTYILTGDMKSDGGAIEIDAKGVTLELDGHTIEFSRKTDKQVFGIVVNGPDAKVFNGRIVQGDTGGDAGYAFAGRRSVNGLEAAGLYCDVHRNDAYPMSLWGSAGGKIKLHHNDLYSTVRKIESRHYPGNDLLRVDVDTTAEVEISDNILTEGCHRAITLMGDKPAKSAAIHDNDIRHNMLFTNGYAFNGNLAGAKVYRNRVTSLGRFAHLTAPGIEFYENWCSIKGHVVDSDYPQGSGKWVKERTELHGVKFENASARQCKVHDNYVQITQPQPDSQWDYVPATTLNIGATDPNAMNEVYNNTFVALTSYKNSRHGSYAESGEWAATIYFVASAQVKNTDKDKYFVYIHDNKFISNDIFIGNDEANGLSPSLGIRIEKNSFILGENPTDKPAVFFRIPKEIQESILKGGNTFEGIKP